MFKLTEKNNSNNNNNMNQIRNSLISDKHHTGRQSVHISTIEYICNF